MRRARTSHCDRPVDESLVHHLHSHAHGCRGGALAHPGLENPQLLALDRELDVAHVAVVAFQCRHDPCQFGMVDGMNRCQVCERERVANSGHHVFSLGVLQVVPVRDALSGRRVSGETDASAGVVAQITEHHRLHVARCTQIVRDPVESAVLLRPSVVPRTEHRPDGGAQLVRTGRRVSPPRLR